MDRLAPPRPGPDHSIRLRDSVVDYVGDSVVDYVELVNTIAADRRNVVQLGHVSATRR